MTLENDFTAKLVMQTNPSQVARQKRIGVAGVPVNQMECLSTMKKFKTAKNCIMNTGHEVDIDAPMIL